MKTITVTKHYQDGERFKGLKLDKTNHQNYYDNIYDKCESVKAVITQTGEPLFIVIRKALSTKLIDQSLPFWLKCKEPITNRGTAAGVQKSEAINYKSKVRGGYKTNTNQIPGHVARKLGDSATVGYYDRYARIPYARVCRYNQTHLNLWLNCIPLIAKVDKTFAQYLPEQYAIQKEFSLNTSPDWIIADTVFSTITVNRNFQAAIHLDAGDLDWGFGCMAYLERGTIQGGYLVFPCYRQAIKLYHGDIILFNVHEWHGNTPFYRLNKNSDRITLVFYYRKNLLRCGNADYELNRAKICRDLKRLYDDSEIAKADKITKEILAKYGLSRLCTQ